MAAPNAPILPAPAPEAPIAGLARVLRVDSRGRRALAFEAIAGGRWRALEDLVAQRVLAAAHD